VKHNRRNGSGAAARAGKKRAFLFQTKEQKSFLFVFLPVRSLTHRVRKMTDMGQGESRIY